MKRIVITLPHFFDGEARRIAAMLDNGAERVHIRKPGSSVADMRRLLDSIPQQYRSRLSLHDHQSLAGEYGIGGVHLNSRCPEAPANFRGLISRSCHTIAELADAKTHGCAYTFLSPVYNSISKPGYAAAFTHDALADAASRDIIDNTVYALGGVTPAHFAGLEALGFGGAALLGAAWTPVSADRFVLQFITPDRKDRDSLAALVADLLDGGCRWVQLRCKDATPMQICHYAEAIAPLCRRVGATFILDDHVELVEACRADGVHLGKNDMPVVEAHRILGPGYIVGATANTAADIEAAAAAGADYIGLGPLRFTTTKKNLSPVLGYEGYADIIARIRAQGIALPVVAIGGIVPTDIAPLKKAGADGIAISGAISSAASPTEATAEFIRQLRVCLLLNPVSTNDGFGGILD